MFTKLLTLFAVTLSLFSGIAFADQATTVNPLVGTWKLKSFVKDVSGQQMTPLGDNPSGMMIFTSDGHFVVIMVGEKRAPLKEVVTQDKEATRKGLLFAFAGTFSSDADKINYHVNIARNPLMDGKDIVRGYKLDGDTLTIIGAPEKMKEDGKMATTTAIYERMASEK